MWMGWLQIKHPGDLEGVGDVDFSNRLLSIAGYTVVDYDWYQTIKKCHFAYQPIRMLGHHISRLGVAAAVDKVAIIRGIPLIYKYETWVVGLLLYSVVEAYILCGFRVGLGGVSMRRMVQGCR